MIIQDLSKKEHFISSLSENNKEYDMGIIEFIFIENNKYYSLSTDYYLYLDVEKMPNYIQKDWIEKHRSDLSLSTLNKHIKNEKDKLDLCLEGTEDRKSIQKVIDRLISIRRDFILKGIL